jgi:hypothetical protein
MRTQTSGAGQRKLLVKAKGFREAVGAAACRSDAVERERSQLVDYSEIEAMGFCRGVPQLDWCPQITPIKITHSQQQPNETHEPVPYLIQYSSYWGNKVKSILFNYTFLEVKTQVHALFTERSCE